MTEQQPIQVIGGSLAGTEAAWQIAQKVKGRKWHLWVDVLGLVWGGMSSAANVAEVKAAPVVLVPALENMPRFAKILADQSDKGRY